MQLFEYQKQYLKGVKNPFWYDCDTGTGKTVMGLTHAKAYQKRHHTDIILIAPASKLREGGWDETAKRMQVMVI